MLTESPLKSKDDGRRERRSIASRFVSFTGLLCDPILRGRADIMRLISDDRSSGFYFIFFPFLPCVFFFIFSCRFFSFLLFYFSFTSPSLSFCSSYFSPYLPLFSFTGSTNLLFFISFLFLSFSFHATRQRDIYLSSSRHRIPTFNGIHERGSSE